jgi:hypothetical protein
MHSVPGLRKELIAPLFGSWKPVSSAWELLRKGASQQEQEPLDTEVEDVTSLEATTKQHSEECECKH